MLALKPYALGIDPGLKGALAILSIEKPRDKIVIEDLPVKDGSVDDLALISFLDLFACAIRFCVIEKVSAMTYVDAHGQTRGQGAAASFNFGKGYGQLLGVLHTLQIPTFEIAPSVWKILMGLGGKKKADSISKAKELYPASILKLTLKKHDGRAEALLLAHFGAEKFGGGK